MNANGPIRGEATIHHQPHGVQSMASGDRYGEPTVGPPHLESHPLTAYISSQRSLGISGENNTVLLSLLADPTPTRGAQASRLLHIEPWV